MNMAHNNEKAEERLQDFERRHSDLQAELSKHRDDKKALAEALRETQKQKEEIDALLVCARAVLTSTSFPKTAREIFDVCRTSIGARSGYVALLSEAGQENEVLFLESGGLDCTVDPELPMPIRGLRSESYRMNKTVFHNDFMNSQWVAFMPAGHVVLNNVLFAPLIHDDRTVGLIGIANKDGGFTEADARLATAFGEIASIALQNSRTLDQLREALSQVKTLSGLLPICASCKKIRDDKGYWNQIESYIRDHSEAEFSHGICPECVKKLYPDFCNDD